MSTTLTAMTATIDDDDSAEKNEKKGVKAMQNGPKAIQNGPKTIQKRRKNDPKTAEKEICIIGYMYRCLLLFKEI